jgi:hypothetical protein
MDTDKKGAAAQRAGPFFAGNPVGGPFTGCPEGTPYAGESRLISGRH